MLNRTDRGGETVSSAGRPMTNRVEAIAQGGSTCESSVEAAVLADAGRPVCRALCELFSGVQTGSDGYVDLDRSAVLVVSQVEAFFDLLKRHRVGHDVVEPGVFPGQEMNRDVVVVLAIDDSVTG